MPGDDSGSLAVEEVRVVAGSARGAGRTPCPACGRAITAGAEVATSLGDVRRGAVGVTVHARCLSAIGRSGLLELMVAAYRRQDGPVDSSEGAGC